MSEISKIIAEIKSEGILRAGNKLEQLYGLAEQKEKDYAALQQKLDAMAAENAALMKFCKNSAFDADYESELGMERGGFTDAVNDIKTPFTDAYLNSVRAGVLNEICIAFVRHVEMAGLDDDEKVTLKECTDVVLHCAEQLCSGTHDTEDKAG